MAAVGRGFSPVDGSCDHRARRRCIATRRRSSATKPLQTAFSCPLDVYGATVVELQLRPQDRAMFSRPGAESEISTPPTSNAASTCCHGRPLVLAAHTVVCLTFKLGPSRRACRQQRLGPQACRPVLARHGQRNGLRRRGPGALRSQGHRVKTALSAPPRQTTRPATRTYPRNRVRGFMERPSVKS
jgi:hypothetical protein